MLLVDVGRLLFDELELDSAEKVLTVSVVEAEYIVIESGRKIKRYGCCTFCGASVVVIVFVVVYLKILVRTLCLKEVTWRDG